MTFVSNVVQSLPAASWAPAWQEGVDAPAAPQAPQGGLEYENLSLEFDAPAATLWCRMHPQGRPSFTEGLLRDIAEMQRALGRGQITGEAPLRHVVLASATPGIYNLGGDLALFVEKIRARDLAALRRYGHVAVEAIHRNHTAFGLPVTTIALVQGDALGGGFECALASDVLIAEESAQMGLPEILFNLFPGMGACSLLARRIGIRAAEELILSGKIMTAAELHRLGVVDVVATDGQGETAVRNWIAKNAKRRNGMQAVFRARQFIHPVTRQELDGIVELWVDAAMRLGERDLKMMHRLVRAQMRRMETGQAAELTEPLIAA